MSTCDVFNCLSPLNVQNEIQLLSRVFCYSWLVCLLGLSLTKTSLVKVGNPISDGIVSVFHLACSLRSMAVLSSRAHERRSREIRARSARERAAKPREKQVASTPISSRFLCPRPPLLLSAPNQNRHATQATLLDA